MALNNMKYFLVVSVVMISLMFNTVSFAAESRVLEIWLDKNGKEYSLNQSESKKILRIKRVDESVYLLNGKDKVLLGKLMMGGDGKYLKGAPDILLADITFDKNLKFLIKQGEGISNVFYKIVDENGVDISMDLFEQKSTSKLKKIYLTDEGDGFLLPSPYFDYNKKTIECFDKDGPASFVKRYRYKNGKYHIIRSIDPFYVDKGFVIAKETKYLDDGKVEILISNYEADENIIVVANKRLTLSGIPQTNAPVTSYLDAGRSATVIDILQDGSTDIWLKVITQKENNIGWIKENKDFNISSINKDI